jgi:tRNA pseudouridine38-40 synthase
MISENPFSQKFALLLSYRGTFFQGWQRQPGFQSIQQTIEEALFQMTKEQVSVVGSGRTDSGVHALGQVAHFTLNQKKWDPLILQKGLNALLPRSIRVLSAVKAPLGFHAQRSAIKKQYGFYIQTGPSILPHFNDYSWWVHHPLDFDLMKQSLQVLVGEHDFKAFQASGSNVKTTVRRIEKIELKKLPIGFPVFENMLDEGDHFKNFSFIKLEIVGNGFLKQMVRSIVGTMVKVGEGKYNTDIFSQLLETQKRENVGPTAKARGLWLERVWYKDLNFFDSLAQLD